MSRLDQALRTKIAHADSDVPDSVWHNVEATLSDEKGTRTLASFWIIGLGILFVMTIATYAYCSYAYPSTGKTATSSNASSKSDNIIDLTDSTYYNSLQEIKGEINP